MLSANLPFRAVENKELRDTFCMLRSDVRIVGRTTIRKQLDEDYKEAMKRMIDDLPPTAKVSIALDGWQSPFKKSYIAITAYYITSDWNLRERLIGFERITGSHTGSNMADIVINCLNKYDITNRLYCITTDNAGPNGTMREGIGELLENLHTGWSSDETRIPCLAHVLQLVVKAGLAALGLKQTKKKAGKKRGGEEEVEEESDDDEGDDVEDPEVAAAVVGVLGNSVGETIRKASKSHWKCEVTSRLDSNTNILNLTDAKVGPQGKSIEPTGGVVNGGTRGV